ncbi:MAG: MBL fold metallo-hydrolase [Alphaproteobacteria bacterium]|nr:MBL fold metallo-hydrolase [Alphaproteobacteria bacterium]
MIPFVRDMEFEYGKSARVSRLVRRVVARNPSPFTYHGTGTLIVGRGNVAVVDPGPDMPEHVEAILGAVAGERVTHIFVTHSHRDHSPAAAALKARTGAPIYGFGPVLTPGAGGVEEGIEQGFEPDVRLADGDSVAGDGWSLEALYTPGHISNHLCYALPEEDAVITGDHVMGWSTTVVIPPDGDMAAYMASLDRLLARDDAILYPAHGPAITAPRPFLLALAAHRRARERQILDQLAKAPAEIPAIVAALYADIARTLHKAAGRSVLAHLIDLERRGIVARRPGSDADGEFRLQA